jgi:hypothetical protein
MFTQRLLGLRSENWGRLLRQRTVTVQRNLQERGDVELSISSSYRMEVRRSYVSGFRERLTVEPKRLVIFTSHDKRKIHPR